MNLVPFANKICSVKTVLGEAELQCFKFMSLSAYVLSVRIVGLSQTQEKHHNTRTGSNPKADARRGHAWELAPNNLEGVASDVFPGTGDRAAVQCNHIGIVVQQLGGHSHSYGFLTVLGGMARESI